MKTLYLIRHAKSDWSDYSLDDFDRVLSKRGLKDASIMASVLCELNIFPDIIISSEAKRAKTTVNIISKNLYFDKEIVYDDSFYFSTKNLVLDTLSKIDDKNNIVFAFGHNPMWNILSNYFTGEYIENIPTCGVFGIDFNISSWMDILHIKGKKVLFEYPKKHKKC